MDSKMIDLFEDKVLYIVDTETKKYETVCYRTPAEAAIIEDTVWAMVDLFCLESVCIKHVEPEFEEVE